MTRRASAWLGLAVLFLLLPESVNAQLASSFYNVTRIQTRVLPNAVQLTIRSDGTLRFGTDLDDFVDMEDDRFAPKPTTSLRLRLVGARSRLPAFVDIGAYPVDSAAVTPGRDELVAPYFATDYGDPAEPKTDLTLRFYVPVTVRRLVIDRQSRGSEDWSQSETAIRFGPSLESRDVAVELGVDRRSIVVTVMTDRSDTRGAARMRRSPAETHKQRLAVTQVVPGRPDRLRVDALHTPLADLLDAASAAAGVPVAAQADAAAIDVSVLLPDTSLEGLLRALRTGYGLGVVSRDTADGGGIVLGRTGAATVTESLALKYLSPERARLLFPDFLLPSLRADSESNTLQVSSTPEVIARMRSDLTRLDLPPTQIRVEASAYEFASEADASYALRMTHALSRESKTLDTPAGTLSVFFSEGQKRAFTATVEAMQARGRARLTARPFVTVVSGESGTLFLGQRRYVTVLQQRGRRQIVQALRLSIGYSLTVQPTAGGADDILLDVNPRISTVDSVEPRTGLPTLGIRETSSVVRLRPNEAAVISGLETDLSSTYRQRFTPLSDLPLIDQTASSRRASGSTTALLILITARKIS